MGAFITLIQQSTQLIKHDEAKVAVFFPIFPEPPVFDINVLCKPLNSWVDEWLHYLIVSSFGGSAA